MKHKMIALDPILGYFEKDLDLRMRNYRATKKRILGEGQKLIDFANGHRFFGFHKQEDGWVYREWAPGAENLFVTGDFCNWDRKAYPATKLENGAFELFIPGRDTLRDGMQVTSLLTQRNTPT